MIHKRTLAVLAVAAFAGAALPFGLPQVAHASAAFSSISFMPFPIAQPGTLVADTTIDVCIQPRNSAGAPVGTNVPVFLSFYTGLFTSPGVHTGTALAGATLTPLTQTPTSFLTLPSCTSQGGVVSSDAIPVQYTTPNPTIAPHGRDVIIAADSVADSGITGACPGSAGTLCNNGTYVYSPVTQYIFNPAGPKIAPDGTLTAGEPQTFTVTAEDSDGNAVPGAILNLSLASSAAGGGSATAINNFAKPGGKAPRTESLTNEPTRFGSDNAGAVSVTYTAADPLPTTGTDTVQAQDHPGSPVAATDTYTYGSTVPFSQAPYTPVTPSRVCDSRPVQPGISPNQCNNDSTGAGSGPITSGATRVVTVGGFGGVPASGVSAVVVNVTAINPSIGTFFSVSPDGVSAKSTSTLNPKAGVTLANLVEVGVTGSPGKIDVFNSVGTANFLVDIEGYVSAASTGYYHPLAAPVRICDTRGVKAGIASNPCNGGHTFSSPIVAGGAVLKFNVSAMSDGVPSAPGSVTAVVFNLTAIVPTQKTVLTAYPSNVLRPTASNINVNVGESLPNRVIVQVSSVDNTVSIWNSVGSANVAVDIDGWFDTTTSATQFTAISPARVCDTRHGNPSDQGCFKATVAGGHVLNIDVAGIDGIPAVGDPHAPLAIIANVTATAASTGTFVTVYPGPSATTRPNASDLNVSGGVIATDLVVVTVGPDGTINLFNDLGSLNLIVDILGYYS